MYEGRSFGQRYSEYCEQRSRNKRRMRRAVLTAALVVGVAVLALILSDKVLPIEVWAAPEKKRRKSLRLICMKRWKSSRHRDRL